MPSITGLEIYVLFVTWLCNRLRLECSIGKVGQTDRQTNLYSYSLDSPVHTAANRYLFKLFTLSFQTKTKSVQVLAGCVLAVDKQAILLTSQDVGLQL